MSLFMFKVYEGTKNWYSQDGKWGIGVKKKTKKYTWSVFYDNNKVATGKGFKQVIEACDAAIAKAQELRRNHGKKKKRTKVVTNRKRTTISKRVSAPTYK